MLQKMRWRFIFAAMLAFFAVISLIAVLVNIVNTISVTKRIDQSVESILSMEARAPGEWTPEKGGRAEPPKDMPKEDLPGDGGFLNMPDPESSYMLRFFVVRFDGNAEAESVSTDYVASVGESDALEYAQSVLNSKKERGYFKGYRYGKKNTDTGKVIVFLNAGREISEMRSLLFMTLTISGGSLVLVFVLVVLFAGKAIKPIADNIERQKQFFTDASHELKTPLTSISASVDVLTMEHGEDEWTENIKSQTGRMSRLVSELVTLSRLDEEIPLPNKEHFSLSDAAWEIADVFSAQAKARGKKFSVNIEDNLSFFGDKTAIQQLMSVLLDNAIRYSDSEGEIRFDVTKKRNKTLIEVFNTCQYEKAPDTSRLFDRFYRPDSSRNTETGGTGVGLAIAKAVTEAHGGSIKASCPSGKTMTIRAAF